MDREEIVLALLASTRCWRVCGAEVPVSTRTCASDGTAEALAADLLESDPNFALAAVAGTCSTGIPSALTTGKLGSAERVGTRLVSSSASGALSSYVNANFDIDESWLGPAYAYSMSIESSESTRVIPAVNCY